MSIKMKRSRGICVQYKIQNLIDSFSIAKSAYANVNVMLNNYWYMEQHVVTFIRCCCMFCRAVWSI